MKTAIASILATAAALAAISCAHADDIKEVVGAYAGMALGASSFSADGAANVDDYLAATGRLPLTETISVRGKVGLSFGEVSGDNLPSDAHRAPGHKRSLMAGIGAEYQPWDRVALSISYDYYGKLSDEISAGSLSAGARFSF